MKRTLVALAVAVVALGGCSSSDEDAPAAAEPAAETSSSAPAAEESEEPECSVPDPSEQVVSLRLLAYEFAFARGLSMGSGSAAEQYNVATEALVDAVRGLDTPCTTSDEFELFMANFESLGYRVHLGEPNLEGDFAQVSERMDTWFESMGVEPAANS
ncbi:hypothetical protein [Nocardioides zeae]|uniref:hypothetical protein n=1 Tax=Nocardioides zeae TaxID=1457234 RepID=UPI0027D873FC|nr:hypothetical protein [Nocardioides zeae]